MPILHAAYKDIGVTKRRTLRNLSVKSRLKTETKKFINLLASKKLDEARLQLKNLSSELDKACSKGIIHRNTAGRKISRLTRKFLKNTS